MTPRITPLARAIHLAFATGLTLGSLAVTHAALAQPAASSIIRFDIEAAPLDQALSQFGRQAGIPLSIDASLTAGKASPGVKGSFSVEQGFAQLLAGTGLSVFRTDSGNYLLAQAAEASGALELGATSINSRLLGETTEGTGSYTTGVTSTATKMNLSIRETPQSISVITRQRMDDQQLNNMTSVLNQTPGVTMSQDGGQRYNIYSRGSAINTYQIDGVTTTQENQTRNMPSTLLDTAVYDHIEVVRGATGLMTGAGDPSGVVNVIRKRPTREFQAHVQQGFGSWDYYRSEADVSGPLTEEGGLRGRFVAAKQKNNSFRDWYSEDKDILYGVLEADLDDATLLRFGVDYQKFKTRGSPGVPLLYTNGQQTHFSRSTSSGARWMYDQFETTNYFVNLEHVFANEWQLKLAANYMDSERDNYNGSVLTSSNRAYLNQATGAVNVTRYRANAPQTQKGLDLTLQGPFTLLGRTHQLITGYNYQDYTNHHTGYDITPATVDFNNWQNYVDRPVERGVLGEIFDVESHQQGSYAAFRFSVVDDVHLIVGARVSDYYYDYYYTSPGSWEQAYTMKKRGEVTPYMGVTYDITPAQTLYASYTDIFKPQTAVDRSGKVLDPVIGSNYEMGWKGEFFNGRLNANAAVYLVQRQNLAVDDGVVVGRVEQAAFKASKGETKGFDLEVSGEILPGWNAQASYSHSRTEDPAGERLLTQLPMDAFRLWNTYRFTGDWDKLTVGGGVSWNSGISLSYSSSTLQAKVTQSDYAVASLMARYQVTDNLAATLNLNNLFDEKYYSGIGGSVGHYGDPRNASLNLRYDF